MKYKKQKISSETLSFFYMQIQNKNGKPDIKNLIAAPHFSAPTRKVTCSSVTCKSVQPVIDI